MTTSEDASEERIEPPTTEAAQVFSTCPVETSPDSWLRGYARSMTPAVKGFRPMADVEHPFLMWAPENCQTALSPERFL